MKVKMYKFIIAVLCAIAFSLGTLLAMSLFSGCSQKCSDCTKTIYYNNNIVSTETHTYCGQNLDMAEEFGTKTTNEGYVIKYECK